MKFNCSVTINAPLDKVLDLFVDTENLKEWQDGFLGMEHLSGPPGEPGAKSRITYQAGKRKIDLIETIHVNNLPEEFTALYEAQTMVNTMTSRFVELEDGITRYDAFVEYSRFNGFMPKLMAMLMPGVFRKQTLKWLLQFRDFVESNA
jgi:uncharacterized membrane protein